MNGRATGLILAAFVTSGVALWFAPLLMGLLGLAAFDFIGQVCLAVLALSALDAAIARLTPSGHGQG